MLRHEGVKSIIDAFLTPKAMGCLRLVYHRGGMDSIPSPKISAPMAPMDMKLYMLVVFGLYF